MEPRAFLDLAKTLYDKLGDEAAIRTSVSRSYYALFNLLAQFLEDNGFHLPKSAAKHKIVFRCLYHSDISHISLIAKHLDELHEARNDADYELQLDQYQSDQPAVYAFIKARTAYNDFENFVNNVADRKRVVNGVVAYKRKCPF